MIRELTRLTRDLLVVKIDASRAQDPEVAAEAERERLVALSARFSAEDLMRAFDLLSKAEFDMRVSAHPRFHVDDAAPVDPLRKLVRPRAHRVGSRPAAGSRESKPAVTVAGQAAPVRGPR